MSSPTKMAIQCASFILCLLCISSSIGGGLNKDVQKWITDIFNKDDKNNDKK